MAVWDKKALWSFTVLLAGAVAQNVSYPVRSLCAVKRSTVTLPCTFTYKEFAEQGGKNVSVQIDRVVWCQNHEICQGSTPSVYDSKSNTIDSHYTYLGDKQGNCTLQIQGLQMKDNGIFRFRMEPNVKKESFTGQSGVNVTVIVGSKMRITSSSRDVKMKRGETVTLQCTSICSFHQLDITWFKDGHALSESGPTLQIGGMTAKDSGNYTCALSLKQNTNSVAYTLQVEEAEEDSKLPLIVGVVFGLLLAVITLILVVFIIKRKRATAEGQIDVGGETEQKHPDNIYSNMLPTQAEVDDRPEASQAEDDVSYAAVQFKHNKQKRQVQEAEDSIIYSSVVSRG